MSENADVVECFLWAPKAEDQVVTPELLAQEKAGGRLLELPGFLPTMIAGLRLLVDEKPLVFPEAPPNHWPPPPPKPEIRKALLDAHAACRSANDDPFASLRAAIEDPSLNAAYSVVEELAESLLVRADIDAEFWDIYEVPESLMKAAADMEPRDIFVQGWEAYPPVTWFRGSCDRRDRISLNDVLAVMEKATGLGFDHWVIGDSLEA